MRKAKNWKNKVRHCITSPNGRSRQGLTISYFYWWNFHRIENCLFGVIIIPMHYVALYFSLSSTLILNKFRSFWFWCKLNWNCFSWRRIKKMKYIRWKNHLWYLIPIFWYTTIQVNCIWVNCIQVKVHSGNAPIW